MAEAPNFNWERLVQRMAFLVSRATAHLNEETRSVRSIGFAATLFQDAGALMVIAGEGERAAELLARAGALLVDLGVPYGHVLMALARGENDAEKLGRMIDSAAFLIAFETTGEPEGDMGESPTPLLAAALDQPVQLLALLQGWLLQPAREPGWAPDIGLVRERLDAHGGLRIGTSGIALRDYLRLCDWITGRSGEKQDAPSDVLTLLTAGRAEMLREAMADGYHWDRLIAPAQLVDFSLTVLFVLAARHEVRLDVLLADRNGLEGAFELPMRASRLAREWATVDHYDDVRSPPGP